MQILQLGDTHIGMQRRTWGGPPGWCRADDHRDALLQALAPALRGEVELVIHTGDFFDRSRPPPADRAWAAALLAELGRRVPVVVLAGNHDRRGLRAHFPQPPTGVHVIDRACRLDVAGLRLALVPHHRQAEDWAAAAGPVAAGGVDLLITHQAVAGCAVPGFQFQPGRPAETLAPAHLPLGVPWVLSGHLHPHQVVRCGASTVVYAGSTARTSPGEGSHAKGSVIWQLGRDIQWRFRPHPARDWQSVRTEADLAAVRPGALVSLPAAAIRAWSATVAERGGRVVLPGQARPPRAQLRLF